MLKTIILSFVLLLNLNLCAQKMYETDLDACPLKFIFEDKEQFIHYEPSDSVMIQDLLMGFDEKQIDKLKGVLMTQVVIDTAYNVCLVSYTNKTNIGDRKFDLSNRLAQMPGWKRFAPGMDDTNICALITFGFESKQVTVQRAGYSRNTGRKVLEINIYNRVADTVKVEPKL